MTDPEIHNLIAEQKAIGESVAALTLSWAHVENDLVILLSKLIHDPSAALASVIYFSPSALETRFKIVNDALLFCIHGHTEERRIKALWANTANKFRHLKNTRNYVAHGQIVTHFQNGVNRIRLTAPMFKFSESARCIEKKQLPGLSSNDIKQSFSAVTNLTERLTIFMKILDQASLNPPIALRETLAQAEAKFLHQPQDANNQNSPKPPNQPEPSGK